MMSIAACYSMLWYGCVRYVCAHVCMCVCMMLCVRVCVCHVCLYGIGSM